MGQDKTRLLGIAVIGLLLLNFCTLAFLWLQAGEHRNERSVSVADFIINELNLNEAQQKQFEILKNDHHQKVEQIRRQSRQLHDQFFALLKNDSTDSLAMNIMADSLVSNQRKIEIVTFLHFRDVRKICNVSQKEKFDQVIDEALRMMAPRPPGRPPH